MNEISESEASEASVGFLVFSGVSLYIMSFAFGHKPQCKETCTLNFPNVSVYFKFFISIFQIFQFLEAILYRKLFIGVFLN